MSDLLGLFVFENISEALAGLIRAFGDNQVQSCITQHI